jgi:uncharacterized peroxidase-related enzyme
MAWIKIIYLEEASGILKRQYDAAIKRASKVWNIVSIMSLNPQTMQDSMRFYKTIMFSESPLSRKQREMLAMVVSSVNHCTYWIRAHANDLRVEVAEETANPVEADTFVTKVAKDWKTAGLSSGDQALCAFAEKLTLTPDAMLKDDIKQLEDLGFTHTAVHDAVQVIGYFNYINRVAEALHVDLEVDVRAWEK